MGISSGRVDGLGTPISRQYQPTDGYFPNVPVAQSPLIYRYTNHQFTSSTIQLKTVSNASSRWEILHHKFKELIADHLSLPTAVCTNLFYLMVDVDRKDQYFKIANEGTLEKE